MQERSNVSHWVRYLSNWNFEFSALICNNGIKEIAKWAAKTIMSQLQNLTDYVKSFCAWTQFWRIRLMVHIFASILLWQFLAKTDKNLKPKTCYLWFDSSFLSPFTVWKRPFFFVKDCCYKLFENGFCFSEILTKCKQVPSD